MEVTPNSIVANIEFDLFPRIDESRQSAAIGAAATRLNKDQILLKGFLKPAPLEIVIKNYVREPFSQLPQIKLS